MLCYYLQWRKEKNLHIQQNNVPLKAVSSDRGIFISVAIQRLDGKGKLYQSFVVVVGASTTGISGCS